MKKLFKKVVLTNIFTLCILSAFAQQEYNPIITAMPSLTIAPDARAGGMGDAGVATAPDIYSQHWNPAKYAFASSQGGFALSYTPWLRKVVDDIALMNAVGYYKIGSGNNQAISASIRYFSVGDVNVTDQLGLPQGTLSPYEMAIDLGYSRKLTETFSGAVAIRYIRSDYSSPVEGETGSAGNTFAADIAGYNESYINIGQSESLLSFGANISNIGGKISNDGGATERFIPTNMRLGASLMYPMNDVSTLSFSVDFNKLLVPTPPMQKADESDAEFQKRMDDYNGTSSISGIFKSFSTADGGFSEKIKEITYSAGVEYDYDQKFRLRTGYFHESKMKGNRRYFTFGAGFKMSAFQLDAAYLVSAAQSSPLDQTLRFSLAFDMDGLKQLMK